MDCCSAECFTWRRHSLPICKPGSSPHTLSHSHGDRKERRSQRDSRRHAWLTYSSHTIHPPLVLFLFLLRLLLYALSQFSVPPDSALSHPIHPVPGLPKPSLEAHFESAPSPSRNSDLSSTALHNVFKCMVLSAAQREDENPNTLACRSCLSSSSFKRPFQFHLCCFALCPQYSSQVGRFTVPTLSSSSLYLYPGNFLAGKGLPLSIFQSPSQSQFRHWLSSIILAGVISLSFGFQLFF